MKKNIIILVLFVVIFIMSIIIGVNSGKKCDKGVTETPTDDEVVFVEVTNDEIQTLYENINNAIGMPCGLSNVYFTGNRVTVADLSYEMLFKIGSYPILKNDYKINYSLDSVTANINKFFGSKVQFKADTYNSTPSYKYNYDTGSYEYQNDTGLVKSCTEGKNIVRMVKATKSNSKIEIYFRVIFTKDGKYYKDSSHSTELTNLIREGNTVSTIGSNMRQGSLYKMVFAKEKNYYVFVSSELS